MPEHLLIKFAQQVASYIIGLNEDDATLGAENEGFFVQSRSPGEAVTPKDFRRINVWTRNGVVVKAVAG